VLDTTPEGRRTRRRVGSELHDEGPRARQRGSALR
jgi:hypothetical protein